MLKEVDPKSRKLRGKIGGGKCRVQNKWRNRNVK